MRQAPSTEAAFTHCFSLSNDHPRNTGLISPETNLKKRKQRPKKKKKSEGNNFKCDVCNVSCSSQGKWNGHINSAKHSKNVKQAKKQNPTQQTKPPKKIQKKK